MPTVLDFMRDNSPPTVSTLTSQIREYKSDITELEIRKHRELVQNKYIIESGCCVKRIDIRCLEFFVKLGVSLLTLGFCFTMLIIKPSDCEDGSTIYVSLISVIVTSWMASVTDIGSSS